MGKREISLSVIALAITDAMIKLPTHTELEEKIKEKDSAKQNGHRNMYKNNKAIKEDALNWFIRAGKDFRDTCERADLRPSYVRRKVLKQFKDEGVI